MNVNPDLKLQNKVELSQKLKLTQSMRQAIAILRMGHLELTSYLQRQAEENPLLEVVEPADDEEVDPDRLRQQLDWLAEPYEVYTPDYSPPFEQQNEQWDPVADDHLTLEKHLLSQLNLLAIDRPTYQMARYIIQSLDEKGYLETDLALIAEVFGVSLPRAEAALKIVQSLEPGGVGARNLRECLKLQLSKAGFEDKILFTIVDHHLEALGKNKLKAIAAELGVSLEKVKEMTAIIRKLNPHPGGAFSRGRQVQYIRADVLVRKDKNRFEVELNDSCLPVITISDLYRKMLNSSEDDDCKEYISRKINQASWIISSVQQRNNTLLAICRQITALQEGFFTNGPGHLAPLTLKEVASRLQIHESTVSRGIHDKYLQCSWGIYPLKSFFTSGFDANRTHSKQKMTAENIKSIIKKLISAEDKKRPYSDEKITRLLKEEGYAVARRTVAKYREEMNIPCASERKEY